MGGARGVFRHGSVERRRNETREEDPEDSLFPTPKGAPVALLSTPKPPFKAAGSRELFVNSLPALGPWLSQRGHLCVSLLKGTFRTKV